LPNALNGQEKQNITGALTQKFLVLECFQFYLLICCLLLFGAS